MKAQIMKVVAIAVPLLVLFAILDLAGLTNWIIYPVSSVKKIIANKSQAA